MEAKPPLPAEEVPTLQFVEAAIELIESKKEALKQAFDELKAHWPYILPSSLSTWADIESHFSALHSSIILKLASLQHGQGQLRPDEVRERPPRPDLDTEAKGGSSRAVARQELRELCKRMDGEGLIEYMVKRVREREDIRAELEDALDGAGNAVELVLRVAGGFHGECKNEKDKKSAQRNCIMVMDVFMHLMRKEERKGESIGMIVSDVARERARSLAAKWKGMLEGKELTTKMWVEVLAWLSLVGCFRLIEEHDVYEVLEYFTICAHYIRSCELCQILGLENKVPDIIERLLKKGKKLLAVKFIMNFGLKEKFPPMSLIESHVDDALKVAKNAREGGNDSHKAQNVARSRELSALKSAIKVIKEHKLELEYPMMDLEARIQLLRNVGGEKRPTRKQKEKQSGKKKGQDRGKEQLNGQKRPRPVVFNGGASIPTTKVPGNIPAVPSFSQSYLPTAVASAYRPSSYMTSPPKPYFLVSSAPMIASYTVPSNGLHGTVTAPASYSSVPSSVQHYVYPSQSQTSSLYYDRPNPYGGHAYPSHHYQSYYPE